MTGIDVSVLMLCLMSMFVSNFYIKVKINIRKIDFYNWIVGMEFHELLEISQGERRRYHDDISVVIISLEGKIWHS